MIYTKLSGDPFFQFQAVAVALLRVVRLGVVVGVAEAGCMGAGAEPSGAVAGALLRAISWLTRQKQGACHRPTYSPYPCSPPLPLLHTQAHEKAAMRTAREPMRTAAERKDCPKGWAI